MKKNSLNIYIFLLCIYNLQGILYTSGSLISRLILAVVLVWSFYYFIIANTRFKLPKAMKMLTALIVIWFGYGVINLLTGSKYVGIPSYYYLKNIFNSLLPIYAFYVFARRGQLTRQVLTAWIYVFVIIVIANFYRNQQEKLVTVWRDEVTNNMGYLMLSILPLLPILRHRPLIQYAILGVLMFFVLQGMKRGAIIVGAVGVVFFLLESFQMNKQSNNKIGGNSFFRVLLTIGIVFFTVYFIQRLLISSDYFNERIERTLEGDSSGRDVLYEKAIYALMEGTKPLYVLFGRGGDATLRVLGNYAHNDWFEIAINNGFWMLLLYVVYWVSLMRYIIRIKKINKVAFVMLGLFFIVYFLKTFFSMSYCDTPFYASCAMGYALANGENPIDEVGE